MRKQVCRHTRTGRWRDVVQPSVWAVSCLCPHNGMVRGECIQGGNRRAAGLSK